MVPAEIVPCQMSSFTVPGWLVAIHTAGYSIADLGSLNGSYVNRDRIDSDVTLSGGDEVQIGKYRLIYFAGALKGEA